MSKSITEQLVDKNLLPHTRKTYFERNCDEYNRLDMSKKVEVLTRIVRDQYDLRELISEYQEDYEGSRTLDSLNNTLQGYVGFITNGKVTDPITYHRFKNASLEEVVDALVEAIEGSELIEQ